ncbi:hypothetical protein [Cellulomonas sp. PhB143]|uniref:hypothetical protein n=1 Tax=Cellulomonas sp. PhB143 TaxID=2485186 RepID=UPI000F473D0F|nr:hypothetical protein [Cellulomonas sp. PhB143]ROS78848.1 hypothetical protein EDF32_0757 [Cellulomonas sp. PhB143]
MQITLEQVGVRGRREPLLSRFSVAVATGSAVLVAGEPGHGHTALALVASGRMHPSEGLVLLAGGDAGSADAAATPEGPLPALLREVTAVVDVPGVSEPDEALTVADVVAEGLSLAGRPDRPRDVRGWIAASTRDVDRGTRVDQLTGPQRVALLLALGAADPRVRFLVLVLPDRHGGDPAQWWDLALAWAARGYGVLVGATRSSARMLGADLPEARGTGGVDPWHAPPVVALTATPAPDSEDPR